MEQNHFWLYQGVFLLLHVTMLKMSLMLLNCLFLRSGSTAMSKPMGDKAEHCTMGDEVEHCRHKYGMVGSTSLEIVFNLSVSIFYLYDNSFC